MFIGEIALIVATFMVPLLSPTVRENPVLLYVVLAVLLGHHGLSFYNLYLSPLPGSDFDSLTFYSAALKAYNTGSLPRFGVGSAAYQWMLYLGFYLSGGTSRLSGQLISILAYAISMLYIVGILKHLRVDNKYCLSATLLVIGFLPTVWFFTSLSFREPLQMLGLAGGIYFFFRFSAENKSRFLAISWLHLLFMGLFHQIALAYAVFVMQLSLIFYFYHRGASPLKIAGYGLLCIMLVSVAAWFALANLPTLSGDNYIRKIMQHGGIASMVDSYRASVESQFPRSSYGYSINSDSWSSFTIGLLRSYGSYLFGPTFADVRSTIDWVPLLNTLFRWVALAVAVVGLFTRKSLFVYSYLLFIALTLAFIWSVGTTNYGQAFRHNTLTDWIFVALCVSVLCEKFLSRGRSGPQVQH